MNNVPWIDELSLKEWESIIDAGPRPFDVFEWGSGGSTIWFGQKQIGKVYSVEHNLKWYDTVKAEKIKFGLDNVFTFYIPSVPDTGCMHSLSVPNTNFYGYTNLIRDLNSFFDFIVIDGRARVMCFENACSYVKDGGYVVLHDSERKMYDACRTIATRWGLKTHETQEKRSTLLCQKISGIVP